MSRSTRTCSHPECEKTLFASGWCQLHYTRVRSHGDPDVVLKTRGMGTLEENFWSHVEKTSGCWNWTGHKHKTGYGRSRGKKLGTTMYAHRFAWEISRGDIPSGMQLDHICHNRACVNPSHLRIVNQKQNNENVGSLRSDNSTGYRGVRLDKRTGKYRARTYHHGKEYSAGTHATAEAAHEAAKELRNRLFTHNNLDRIATTDEKTAKSATT